MSKSRHSSRTLLVDSSLGFTLVELLFVVSLSVIITLAAAGLFFTTLISNSRRDIISTVKNEGDYAISQMEFLLRNAITLVPDPTNPTAPACTTGMNSISFRSRDNDITTLFTDNGKVASKAAAQATPQYMTSTAVTLQNLSFDCTQQTQNLGTYVRISFNLQKTAPDFNTTTPVSESFSTSVNVRSL